MLSLFTRKSPEKLFLSLVISEGTVAAALWTASHDGQSVVARSLPKPWDDEVETSLIDSSDAALNETDPKVNSVKEVLLGLPDSWAAETTIAPNKKRMLHSLAKQLNLKSVGFVIVPEAIVASFRDREKSGLNALLAYISEKSVYLIPVINGQAGESARVNRSDSLVNDLVEASARGNYSNLPGRILLASQDLTETMMMTAQQQLQATEWKEKLFAHHPRVDLVTPQMILDAVSLSGGREVARALGIMAPDKKTPDEQPEVSQENESFGFKPVETDGQEASEPENELGEENKVEMELVSKPGRRKVPKIIKPLMLAALALLLVGGIVFAATNAIAKAEIDVTVKSQPVSFEAPIMIDANASESNPDANILKATQRSKTVEGTADAVSTGTKVVGDKAKGEVTVYNRTTVGDKLFKAGTILKLDNNVAFATDADVTVSVGTQDSGFVGKATVAVTATNIGAESNIKAGTMLVVDGFDKASYYATTNADFTGGTSRNVQIVSDTDQKKLADSLFESLKQKALAAFNSEVSPGEYVAPSDTATITKKVFSDDIGKEVKTFTLTMAVTANAVIYTNQDIVAFATTKLASQIPPGSTLKAERTTIEIKDQQPISENKTQVNAKISSIVTPAFDSEKLKNQLAGQPIPDALSSLAAETAFSQYHVAFTPVWAEKLLRRMPSASKITVNTSFE